MICSGHWLGVVVFTNFLVLQSINPGGNIKPTIKDVGKNDLYNDIKLVTLKLTLEI